jgi:hypothetical protein
MSFESRFPRSSPRGAHGISRDRVVPRWKDNLEFLDPDAVQLGGWLGTRVDRNARRRLMEADEAGMLAGFRKRPGAQAWIGEHAGKFLHAACLATRNRPFPALAAKRDRIAKALIAAQEPDGYLGTYLPEKRFGLYPDADWDVWVHKYCLIGLLAWHDATGNRDALRACERIGDLLMREFPVGGKTLASAGTHRGMAATSVLEPIVLLHRRTGNPALLDFARRIVAQWEQPGGPGIATSLRAGKGVERTANAKAYEMLSNLVGLCELARTTGERSLIEPVRAAWVDIVQNHRYITGSMSRHEHFGDDFDLPNGATSNVGETCVTTTWIQLNAHLLRLTGEPAYAAEIERSLWNHLAAAQRPDGAQWCYYTALEGTKPYGPGINCCVSSGPRAMAMAPSLAVMADAKGNPVLLLPESLEVQWPALGNGASLHQEIVWNGDRCEVRLWAENAVRAVPNVRWRVPEWASGQLRGEKWGWADLPVGTSKTRPSVIKLRVPWVVEAGAHGNSGLVAMRQGPWVYAAESDADEPGPWRMRLQENPSPATLSRSATVAMETRTGVVRNVRVLPFAEAGAKGERFAVWLPDPGHGWPTNPSLVIDGEEGRSHPGNVQGSIVDGNPKSFVVTFDGTRQASCWFSVELFEPTAVTKVVYCHGHAFVDGGWFAKAPMLEARRKPGGAWEPLGELPGYPAVSQSSPAGLVDGQAFTLVLPSPVEVSAVRVIGVPASGNQTRLSFSSCGELSLQP